MYIIVYVNGTDLHPPAGFSRIELLNVNGTFIREYKLTKSTTEPNIYRTRSFVPPVGYFYVKVFKVWFIWIFCIPACPRVRYELQVTFRNRFLL